MKQEKVGKKPKGMVLVISVGKPTGKKPEREADPDSKKKMDRLSSEMARGTNRPLPSKFAAKLAGNQARNQVRYQQGPTHDPNLEFDEDLDNYDYHPSEDAPDLSLVDDIDANVRPRHIRDIPGAMNNMSVEDANAFNARMADRNQAKLQNNVHMLDLQNMRRQNEQDEALKAIMKGEHVNFCDCCSPAEIAWAITKAKKKSKPFHGYNPNKHHRKGGLNAKGRAKAKRETGANLKAPVTKKPSSLKPGSKSAKRRKSFCARMSGMKGATSKKGKLTPKGASLKRWNC